jgi:hypothetical protein
MEDFDYRAWVEQAVLANLQNRFADFWKNHEMKLYDLRVSAYAPGSLRNGRKLKRVLDQREMTPAAPRVNQGIE